MLLARVSRELSRSARLETRTLQPVQLPLQVPAMEAELLCPACRIPLTEMRTGTGIIWRCEKCDGRAVGLQLLRRTFTAGIDQSTLAPRHP